MNFHYQNMQHQVRQGWILAPVLMSHLKLNLEKPL